MCVRKWHLGLKDAERVHTQHQQKHEHVILQRNKWRVAYSLIMQPPVFHKLSWSWLLQRDFAFTFFTFMNWKGFVIKKSMLDFWTELHSHCGRDHVIFFFFRRNISSLRKRVLLNPFGASVRMWFQAMLSCRCWSPLLTKAADCFSSF